MLAAMHHRPRGNVMLQIDPAAYRENRIRAVTLKKEKGLNPYPHKFNASA